MKKSCPVCGQSRCVESKDCLSYEAGGMIDGQYVEIYTRYDTFCKPCQEFIFDDGDTVISPDSSGDWEHIDCPAWRKVYPEETSP